jgi:hypothetical protein
MLSLFFRRDITIKSLLLALTACLFAFQYHTLAKLSAFHPATSHVSLTRFFILSANKASLTIAMAYY